MARRAQHPESSWWETEVVRAWLKLLVLGVVYYFGIKQGIGALVSGGIPESDAFGASCGLGGNGLAQIEAKNEGGNCCLRGRPSR